MTFLMLMSAMAAPCPAMAQPPEKIPVIIKFKDDSVQASAVLGATIDITYKYSIIPAIAARLTNYEIQALSKNKEIAYIEPDREMHMLEEQLGWGVDRIDAERVSGAALKIRLQSSMTPRQATVLKSPSSAPVSTIIIPI